VAASEQTIEEAIEWINEWNQQKVLVSDELNTCEALMIGFLEKKVRIYFASETRSILFHFYQFLLKGWA
jgi:hypothetical protein